jgi:tripartite-type tricarboxylate transporter receptor subunit TctC
MARFRFVASVLVGVSATASLPSAGWGQAEFYRGKTVSMMIGSRLTGTLSIAALAVSHHLGKHIPGNPAVILRQMPGGAHLNATNYVFNVAEPDGLTILAANPAVAMAQLFKVPAVRFDVRKFVWLGSSGADGVVFAIRPDLPYRTFKDLQSASPELVVGTTGPGSNSYDTPMLLKQFAGAKLRLISGYAANDDIRLALERKEVDGWTALATTVKLAAERGVARPMVRGRAPAPGLDDLPVDEDLAQSEVGRSLMVIRGMPLAIGRPYAVRPGTPPERVAVLQKAVGELMADPAFLAEARTAQIDMTYISAEDVSKAFDRMFNQPPEALEAMHSYFKVGE